MNPAPRCCTEPHFRVSCPESCQSAFPQPVQSRGLRCPRQWHFWQGSSARARGFRLVRHVFNLLQRCFYSYTRQPCAATDGIISIAQLDMIIRSTDFHAQSTMLRPHNNCSASSVRRNLAKVLQDLIPSAPNAFNVGGLSHGLTLLDSGASANFIRDRQAFISYKTVKRTVNLGNGVSTDQCIIGEGKFILHCVYIDGLACTITGSGAHTPSFPNSLLSSSQLSDTAQITSIFR